MWPRPRWRRGVGRGGGGGRVGLLNRMTDNGKNIIFTDTEYMVGNNMKGAFINSCLFVPSQNEIQHLAKMKGQIHVSRISRKFISDALTDLKVNNALKYWLLNNHF